MRLQSKFPNIEIAMHRRLLLAGFVSGCLGALLDPSIVYADNQVNSATIPLERSQPWWQERHQACNALAAKGNIDLLFIGDSITQRFETQGKTVWDQYYAPRNPLNLGFGSDSTQHVLWRLEHGNIDGLQPKLAVVLIGANNTATHSAAEMAAGIEAVVNKLRAKLPSTKVLLLAIFPIGAKPGPDRVKNAEASKIASQIADEKDVFYLDIGDQFLASDGTIPHEIMPDEVHLSEQGFKIWAESMEPLIDKLMRGQIATSAASKSEWSSRRDDILRRMQQAMGEMPERSKLGVPTAIVDAEVNEPDLTRQTLQIIVDEQDRVPAYLYLPSARKPDERRAAVLALHQTSARGKQEVDGQGSPDQGYARELAAQGYVVLAPDYPSFGDYACDFSRQPFASGTMKGVYNHTRCIDFLASRAEVDPERIGVIGHSLGGHNAMFLAAFDPRIQVVVASCGWSPFADHSRGDLTAWAQPVYMPRIRDRYHLDPKQMPFDFDDVIAAIAPRPFLSIAAEHDADFGIAGVKRGLAAVQPVYARFAAEQNLKARYFVGPHSFPANEHEAAYTFLDQHLRRTVPQ